MRGERKSFLLPPVCYSAQEPTLNQVLAIKLKLLPSLLTGQRRILLLLLGHNQAVTTYAQHLEEQVRTLQSEIGNLEAEKAGKSSLLLLY